MEQDLDETSDRLRQAGALMRRGELERAYGLCMQELAARPQSAEACSLLGLMGAQLGNPAKAAEMFAEAVKRAPHTARYRANLAKALCDCGRPADAAAAAQAALQHGGDDLSVLASAAGVLSQLGRHAQALQALERLAAADPDDTGHLYQLGAARQFTGDMAGAAQAYRRMLALDPADHRGWWALVQLERQTPEHGLVEPMRERFEAAAGAIEPSLYLGHALAKSFEDMGEPEAAFDWLVRAKSPKRAAIARTAPADEALFEAAVASPPSGEGFRGEAPIFVVGQPRSGTTLVDRILSSHPGVVSAGERNDLFRLVKAMGGSRTPMLIDPPTLAAARHVDPARLGQAYAAAARPAGSEGLRFTDKAPLNFLYAGVIHATLPEGRIVCLRRHPMDSCLSVYRQLFATDQPYYDYGYDLDDLARHYLLFDRLMAHWRATLPPDRFTEIAYEDLVADQEGQTRRLLDFCGLDWDPACLDFHLNPAAVATASSVQVRQPLHAASVGRWRRYGDRLKPLADVFEAHGIAVD